MPRALLPTDSVQAAWLRTQLPQSNLEFAMAAEAKVACNATLLRASTKLHGLKPAFSGETFDP